VPAPLPAPAQCAYSTTSTVPPPLAHRRVHRPRRRYRRRNRVRFRCVLPRHRHWPAKAELTPLLQAADHIDSRRLGEYDATQTQSSELLVEYLSSDFSQFHICPSGDSNSTHASVAATAPPWSICSSTNLAACDFVGPGGGSCTAIPAVCNPLSQISEFWNSSAYTWQPTCEVCRAISAGNHELDECLKCVDGYHISQDWEDCSGTCVPDLPPTNTNDLPSTSEHYAPNPTLLACADLCANSGLGCVGFQWYPATPSNPEAGKWPSGATGSCWLYPNMGGVPVSTAINQCTYRYSIAE
jgi:hypothetical protein